MGFVNVLGVGEFDFPSFYFFSRSFFFLGCDHSCFDGTNSCVEASVLQSLGIGRWRQLPVLLWLENGDCSALTPVLYR